MAFGRTQEWPLLRDKAEKNQPYSCAMDVISGCAMRSITGHESACNSIHAVAITITGFETKVKVTVVRYAGWPEAQTRITVAVAAGMIASPFSGVEGDERTRRGQ